STWCIAALGTGRGLGDKAKRHRKRKGAIAATLSARLTASPCIIPPAGRRYLGVLASARMQASLGVAHAIDAFGNQKLLVPMPRCVAGHDLGDGACGDIALQIRLPVSTSVASAR